MSRLHLLKSDLLRNYKIKWLPWWSFRYIYLIALPITPIIAIFCDRTVKELVGECVDFIFAKVINDKLKEQGNE